MLFWNYAFYVAIALTVFSILYLTIRKYGKNRFYHSFIADDFIRLQREGGAKNYVYSTVSETKKYIEKYIFRKSAYEKSVVVNYNKKYDSISYFIKVFNRRKKVIDLIEINDTDTSLVSKIIYLQKEAKYINIIVKEVNGNPINHTELMPVAVKNIRFFAFFKSLIFFCVLFIIRHVGAMLYLKERFRPFLTSTLNYIILGIIFIISLVMYFRTSRKVKKKNWKNRDGEAVSYEFF